jgi:hypothetical protein
MMQIVPIEILDSVRTGDRRVIDREDLLAVISGAKQLPVEIDIGDRIADDNFATVSRGSGAIAAVLDAIAADRAASYARVGIPIHPST